MTDWKTTLGGILVPLGLTLQTSDNEILKSAGTIHVGLGGLMVGLYARDRKPKI